MLERCRASICLVLLVGLVAPSRARAYRPFDGTDADVAGPGELELELEPLGFARSDRQRAFVSPAAVANWGFAPGWEAVVEAQQLVVTSGAERGGRWRVEDVALSVKHVLRDGSLGDRTGPNVAVELGALLPEVHGEAAAGGQASLVLSQAWSDATVHLNLAGAWTRAHVPAASGSVIVEGPSRWLVRPVAEVELQAERGARPGRALLVGAIWRVSPTLALDGALRGAAMGDVGAIEVRAGLTWTFAVTR